MTMTNEGKFILVGAILVIVVVPFILITNPSDYGKPESSMFCDFYTVISNETIHLQPYSSEILPYRLVLPYRQRAEDICIINIQGNPVEVETYRDDGDGKTFQEDHQELKKVLLMSGGANTVRIISPGGNVGMMLKVTNPYNFTSDVRIVVTGVNTK